MPKLHETKRTASPSNAGRVDRHPTSRDLAVPSPTSTTAREVIQSLTWRRQSIGLSVADIANYMGIGLIRPRSKLSRHQTAVPTSTTPWHMPERAATDLRSRSLKWANISRIAIEPVGQPGIVLANLAIDELNQKARLLEFCGRRTCDRQAAP